MNPSNPLSSNMIPDADNCADCGVIITGDDNASAYGDHLNVCDHCEAKREAAQELEE